MRCAPTLSLLLLGAVPFGGAAQQLVPAPQSPELTVRSDLVQVPALVTTRKGEVVLTLGASDFALTDNGIPQALSLVPNTDSEPLALAVIVETGGAGSRHLADYRNIAAILDAFVGSVDHETALVGFDSHPQLLVPFTSNTDAVAGELGQLQPGDNGASILDAVAFGLQMLRREPPRYRRTLLLLSETIDQGSTTTRTEALRLISDTNTTMHIFAFPSTRAAVAHEASKFNRPGQPGPARGCFSHDHTGDPTDAEYDGHYSRQVLDCISDLAPPLRLATMAFLTAHDALRTNTAESIANLSGGEFLHFHDSASLKRDLIQDSNEVHNFYVLDFRPTDPAAGLHALHLSIKDHADLRLQARTEYWIDNDAPH